MEKENYNCAGSREIDMQKEKGVWRAVESWRQNDWGGGCWPASTHHPATCSLSPPAGQGENRSQVRRLMGWDKDNLIDKKAASASSAKKEFINYCPSAGRSPATSWKQEPEHLQGLHGKANVKPQMSPLSSLSFYCWAQHHVVWSVQVPLVSQDQMSWLCPPSSSCTPPSLLTEGQEQKASMLYRQALFTKTWVCNQQFFSDKSKTQHHTGCNG